MNNLLDKLESDPFSTDDSPSILDRNKQVHAEIEHTTPKIVPNTKNWQINFDAAYPFGSCCWCCCSPSLGSASIRALRFELADALSLALRPSSFGATVLLLTLCFCCCTSSAIRIRMYVRSMSSRCISSASSFALRVRSRRLSNWSRTRIRNFFTSSLSSVISFSWWLRRKTRSYFRFCSINSF